MRPNGSLTRRGTMTLTLTRQVNVTMPSVGKRQERNRGGAALLYESENAS